MSRRFQSLDGLRGIAAIMIVLFHVRWSNHLTETHFVREAYLFVDLFFILSGFIITKAYGDRIHALHQAGGFLILRFFRVYPLHIAVLSVFVFCELAKLAAIHAGLPAQPFQQSNAGWTLLANVFLLQCLVVLGAPAWNVPSWSISCEAVAYVLFAAAAMAGLLRRRQFVPGAIIAACVCYAIVLYYKGSLFALSDFALLRCLAGFCFDVVVGRVPEAVLARLTVTMSVAATGGLIAAALVAFSCLAGVWDILIIPIFALLILLLQTDRGFFAQILKSAPVEFLGRISYSVYMVHWFLFVLAAMALKYTVGDRALYDGQYFPMYRVNPFAGDLAIVVMLVVVTLIATVTYRFIETPWRAFGRSLAMRAQSAPVARPI
jgi:peptidoglycan/LPS O-acetylase OafA/YrhL